uniref:Uncharacterized protein n=1 Tax=Anguilla anguilla TaxID=7936 RepID=A0A0E9VGF6_ANGAN
MCSILIEILNKSSSYTLCVLCLSVLYCIYV